MTALAGRLARLAAMAGGAVLLALIAMTCLSVAGRALLWLGTHWAGAPGWLGRLGPVRGDYEMVEIGSGIAVACFLPWCQIAGGHARVTLLPARGADRLWHALMAAAMALLAWRVGAGMVQKMASAETSFLRGLPLWWGYAACLPGLGLAALAAAAMALAGLATPGDGAGPPPADPPHAEAAGSMTGAPQPHAAPLAPCAEAPAA